MDVLFGAGPRWEQKAHGRGAYARKPAFVLKRREERAQPVWDAHLELVRQVFTSRDVPLEANEMALKILRAHGEAMDAIDAEQAQRFWKSELPLLQSLAAREFVTRQENGGTLDGAMWAQLLTRGNARVRRALDAPQGMSSAASWREAAARELEASLNTGRGAKLRRAAEALLRHFAERIGLDTLLAPRTFISLSDTRGVGCCSDVARERMKIYPAPIKILISLSPEPCAEMMRPYAKKVASRTFTGRDGV
jgi:hypothetical protein